MTRHVLTINAGSSSIKFSLVEASDALATLATGEIAGVGGHPRLTMRRTDNLQSGRIERDEPGVRDNEGALAVALDLIRSQFPAADIAAIGHRIVHGGMKYDAPALIDDAVLAELEALDPWAPLHQPHNIAGVRAAQAQFPRAAQVACFDTAFHRGQTFVCDAYGLPRSFYDEGVRRYGFHGLSYDFVSARLAEIAPDVAKGRVVIAHLGNGASMCALNAGRSVASTMGFSTLDGLPMGTRAGQIDPGILLYLLQSRGYDANALSDLLYKRSGLVGLSGISNDLREVEAAGTAPAKEAIDYFVHRIRYELGGLAATLGGLDALVFCGGIGENSASIRAAVLQGMDWLGLTCDPARNLAHETFISPSGSRTSALVIPTNEELRIAQLTAALGLGWRAA